MQISSTYMNTVIHHDTRIKANLNSILQLITYFLKQDKPFFMGTPAIAKILHISTDTVKRRLKDLEDWGYIKRQQIYEKSGRIKLRIIKIGKKLLAPFNNAVFKAIKKVFATGCKMHLEEEGNNINNISFFDAVETQDKLFSEQFNDKKFQEIIKAAPASSLQSDLIKAHTNYKNTLNTYTHEQILATIQNWARWIAKNNMTGYALHTMLNQQQIAKWAPRQSRNQQGYGVTPPLPQYGRGGDSTRAVQRIIPDNPILKQKLEAELKKIDAEDFEALKRGDIATMKKLRTKIAHLELQISRLA